MTEQPKRRKRHCWVCSDAPGKYLNSVLVAFAATESEARELMQAELGDLGLLSADRTVREIPIKVGAHLLWNGDY